MAIRPRILLLDEDDDILRDIQEFLQEGKQDTLILL
ncbi:MAG: hypothetical protein ETSY2_40140 [Candidatus Entotheonella gemina]|uniref:Uncharacterized protein n=1 Tax=Candidatus Entotheonella gemina TaxID=1429439 RepID=W4LQ60_9BACT|nr:MAG: hypothetical protein ETSY2_40140 [Candidatus Entotheonella gemina]